MESTNVKNWPFKVEDIEMKNFWIWNYDDERQMLLDIVDYFKGCWAPLKGKKDWEADLIICGIGISRFDIPIIAFRCNELGVATNEEIWELLFTTKQVDLSNIGIAYANKRDREGSWVLYPKTANELCKEFGVQSVKPSGKKVWDMYEEEDYLGIQTRTEGEVRDTISLYQKMRKRIFRSN